jgi:hypothetical protein
MNYKEAKEFADEYDKTITISDLKDFVYIVHGDFTTALFTNAFAINYNEWYFIFSEHNGYHIYHKEDLRRINQLRDYNIFEYNE